jgi:diguanylate cyclase (GGDEF)-like protein
VRAREGEAQAREELKRALSEQTDLARTDYLTQVSNRRNFFQLAERELALGERHRHAVSIVLLDIDHFKAINDRFGHDLGDEVLKSAAKAMKESLRSTDTLARYGGEEFIVLLPYTDSSEAGQVAQHLRAAIAHCRVVAGSGIAEVTISAGVATARPGETIDALVRRADDALYAAKSTGRNRVVIAADGDDM